MRLKSMLAVGVMALMLPLSVSAAPIVNYGSLDDGEWADLWVISTLGGFFSASTEPSFNHLGGQLDTQLFLIGSDGKGIVANDDHFSLNSYIEAYLAAGTYTLAVSMFGNDPLSNTGLIFPDVFGTSYGNGEVFNGTFTGTPAGFPYNGGYALTIVTDAAESAVPNPEPATLVLMGSALAGAAGRRWRRRKPQVVS